jgi:hypothetical protein
MLDLFRDGDPRYEFFNVGSVTILSDGRFAIADRGSSEVRFYSRQGRFESAFGSSGGGPREFSGLAWIYRIANDSIVAYDLDRSRLTVWTSSGRFARDHGIQRSSAIPLPIVQDVAFDGSVVVLGRPWALDRTRPGLQAETTMVYVDRPPWDSLIRVGAATEINFLSRTGRERIPFSAGVVARFREDGSLAVLDGGRRVIAINHDGSSTVHSPPADVQLVTPALRERYRSWRLGRVPAGSPDHANLTELFEAMPFADTIAAFDQLARGANGEVWLRRYRFFWDYRNHDVNNRWLALDRELQPVRECTFPGALDAMGFLSDRAVGVWRDSLHIEHPVVVTLDSTICAPT